MEPQQEYTGDYGYDEAHREVQRSRGNADPASSPPPAATPPPPPQDAGDDYGYDEAHSF